MNNEELLKKVEEKESLANLIKQKQEERKILLNRLKKANDIISSNKPLRKIIREIKNLVDII